MKYILIILTTILYSCSFKESNHVSFPVSTSYDEFGTFIDNVSHEEYVFFAKKNFNPNLKVFDFKGNFIDSVSLQRAESILGSISKVWMTSMDSIFAFSTRHQIRICLNRNGESIFIDNYNHKVEDSSGNKYNLHPPFLQNMDMRTNSQIVYTTWWIENRYLDEEKQMTLESINSHIREGYLLSDGDDLFGMKFADIVELKELPKSIFWPYYKAMYLDNRLFFLTYYSRYLYELTSNLSIKKAIKLIPSEYSIPIPISIIDNDPQITEKEEQLEVQISKDCFISNVLYCIDTKEMIVITKTEVSKEDLFIYPFQIEIWDRNFMKKKKKIKFDTYNHYPASSFVLKNQLYIEKKTDSFTEKVFEVISL
ncbi:MAG: hypothetical protein WDA68_12090 [Phycisphaerae bacterium]